MNTNTSSLLVRATDALRDEMAANAADASIQLVGNVMTQLLRRKPEIAEKIVPESKGIKKAMEAMKKEASKHKKEEIASRQVRIGELEDAVSKEQKEKAEEAARAIQVELDLKEIQRQKEQAESERNAAIAAQGIAERERDRARADLTAELERGPEKIVEVEVTPPEIEAELERLRRIAREAPNKAVLLAREYYEQGRNRFEAMIEMLLQMPDEDKAKYAAAFAAGLRKMADKVGGSA